MDHHLSRRKGRYLRRQNQRNKNLQIRNESIGTMDDIFTFNKMYKMGKSCCKNVRWKASTQNFERHLFSGTAARRQTILAGTWKPDKYNHFMLCERGKVRPIDAPRIQDRQVHKVFTREVLLLAYLPSMIYNNGASLPGKGFDFSRKQLIKELHWHYRRYGREGSIILLDFKQFFPSVSHQKLYERHERLLLDETIRKFADDIVDSNRLKIGLPLGVEPSQAEMIAFPSELDNYIKCQLSLKCAGHYMDDYYVIVPPDRDAKELLAMIIEKAESLSLTVSRTKTKIAPLTRPFKYCKLKYILTEEGRVVVHGSRDSMKRARRKFKAFVNHVEDGMLSYEDLRSSVNGVIAYFYKYNDHNRVLKLRRLFYSLFGFSCESLEEFRKRDREILLMKEGLKDEVCCTSQIQEIGNLRKRQYSRQDRMRISGRYDLSGRKPAV